MEFRLLIDLVVLDHLDELAARHRRAVMERIRKIQQFPANYSHYKAIEPDGTRLDVSILKGFHVFYWTDVADRHIKILRIEENE